MPAGADVLLVQPQPGLALEALRRGLAREQIAAPAPGPFDAALRVPVPPGADAAALAARVAASGLARGVEADLVVRAARLPDAPAGGAEGVAPGAARRVPDDPLYATRQARYLEVVRAAEAWAVETGDAEVVIAVIDSGVDWNHPDLAEQIFINHAERFLTGRDDSGSGCPDDIAGCNFVSLATADPTCGYRQPPPNWRAMDDDGHGTFVAGIAAARGDNAEGIAGIAWRARILPVKVLDCTATGRISDAAAGIAYAARMGADVINISFGTTQDSLVLRAAIEQAQAAGALVVASAGNDGRRGVTFPAAYPGVLSVAASGLAAVDGIDYRATAPFSNFGAGVDLLAPGVQVTSTVPAARCGRGWICHEEGPYASASGSSFATPMVAGAAALLRARHPERSSEFIALLLLGQRQPARTPVEPPLLDVGAAVALELFHAGVPGASRHSPGDPPGPAPDD